MSQLDSLAMPHQDGAMDLVEQTVLGAGWACERTEEGIVHCASMTKWGTAIPLVWPWSALIMFSPVSTVVRK